MKKATFNTGGTVLYKVLFLYYEFKSAKQGQIVFELEKDKLIKDYDFDAYEQEINNRLENDEKNPLPFGISPEVTIYALRIQEHVMASGVIQKEGEKDNQVTLSAMIADSPAIYLGGKILERHEILKAFNNDLRILAKFPAATKGIITCIPGHIFPYKEEHNDFIVRAAKSELIV